jgi:hypothetical protein
MAQVAGAQIATAAWCKSSMARIKGHIAPLNQAVSPLIDQSRVTKRQPATEERSCFFISARAKEPGSIIIIATDRGWTSC